MSLTNEQITAKNFQKFYNAILPYLNGAAHTGFTPVGTVISVMGTTAPQNYLACDGTVYNIADYPELAAYFTEQFEAVDFFGGNGTTTFAVPDLRGEFLRGTGTNSHTNQGSGANVGVHQDGTIHAVVSSSSGGTAASFTDPSEINKDSYLSTNSFGTWQNASTGTHDAYKPYTSRPTNTSVLYCIATKNIYVDARYDYSTDEKVVGSWIDGKPIYQKTIIRTGVTDTRVVISTSDIPIDFVPLMYGVIKSSAGVFVPLNFTQSVGTDYTRIFWIPSSDNQYGGINIMFGTSDPPRPVDIYATIQYTKTTD